ncbi:MAG: RHS repeat-associated core domain-containing protein [bacterium]|nr:RHS repeat-associated core domain-containing protein [bacterium]
MLIYCGNRTQQIATIAGSATTTNYGYNAANQMTSAGAATLTYDNNGNLTNDGTTAYTWDRANRMLSAGGTSYGYDGAGNRSRQAVSGVVTQYLLDLQPGLVQVIAATTGANTDRYVHAPRGIHAMENTSGAWSYAMQDGLGNVRLETSSAAGVLGSRNYEPFLTPFGVVGAFGMPFAATGEPTDSNGLVHLRARNYAPSMGVFTALDPFEGQPCSPMSLNGYMYVEGSVVNNVDPSGGLPPV